MHRSPTKGCRKKTPNGHLVSGENCAFLRVSCAEEPITHRARCCETLVAGGVYACPWYYADATTPTMQPREVKDARLFFFRVGGGVEFWSYGYSNILRRRRRGSIRSIGECRVLVFYNIVKLCAFTF